MARHPDTEGNDLRPKSIQLADMDAPVTDLVDGDTKADNPHGNEAHTEDYITASDMESSPISEYGEVNHGTVSDGSSSTVDVTFTESYTNPPIVIHGNGSNTDTNKYTTHVTADNITSSGFTSGARNNSGVSGVSVDAAGYMVISND